MTRFRHSVVLEPVPRDWFQDNVGLGHDVLAEYLGSPALPLITGEHLHPGARYADDDDFTVTVDAWNRRAETAAGVRITDAEVVGSYHVRLISASAPRTVELTVDLHPLGRGIRWLTRTAGSLRADLEQWWVGTVREGGVRAMHGWARVGPLRVAFAIAPSPSFDGRWQVTIAGKTRGRGALWPLVSLGVLIARAAVRRQVAAKLDEFAAAWNREVPALLTTSPEELRERIMTELTGH